MIALRHLLKLRPMPRISTICPIHKPMFKFGDKSKLIDEELQALANSIDSTKVREDYSELVSNYIQLQQSSFAQYAREVQYDPQLMLMFLSTFEDTTQIAQHLPLLYPKLDYFEGTELLLLLEKVLAFKPKSKPKVPFPKPLEGIESILVIMSEIYEADKLVQWMKLVPLYNGTDYYVLLMGYFSILEKLSSQVKNRNQGLWIKCHEKISSILSDDSQSVDIRVGILILAFELNYGQAANLLLVSHINYEKVDPYKNCLLFANVAKYLIKRKQGSTVQGNEESERVDTMVKKCLNQMAQPLLKLDFGEFMKVDIMVEMWRIVKGLKEVRGLFTNLQDKLLNLITDRKYSKSMQELSIQELLIIFESMEKHKVNHPKAVKLLLVLFSPHLHNMDKGQFVRLLKCLVTYVRQCEDYLINVRQVLEQRKGEFTAQETLKINEILRRVQVLFPKKFALQ